MNINYRASIIIPTYNSQKTIEVCLSNIIDESKKLESEIIVIDDNSSDKTIEIIKENEFAISLMVLFAALHFISFKQGNLAEKISKFKLRFWVLFLAVIFLSIALFYVGSAQEFIYFEF